MRDCCPRCAAGPSAESPQRQSTGTAESPRRTLTIIARGEPPSLAAKPLRGTGGALDTFVTLYNATFDWIDDAGNPRPYLVEAVPSLN